MKKKRLLIATLILVAIGLVMVYSSSHIWAEAKFNDSFYYIKRQALFAVVGLVGVFCAYILTIKKSNENIQEVRETWCFMKLKEMKL